MLNENGGGMIGADCVFRGKKRNDDKNVNEII